MNDIEGIFLAARELPPEERAPFLDQACTGDPTGRARVEALLARAAEAAEFFGEETQPGSPEELLRLQPDELIGAGEREGSTIGRYKLLQRIGEGGMGVVYMAEQEEPVRRRVALKIIKLGMDTRQVVARFEAERQALAIMDHPNIAKVLDGGATDSGRPYFVMELVAGVPITEFCDRNRLGIRDRINLFLHVCKAIQSAHQKGVIHRDIKPSNVIVTLHHGDPMPKVIDFGVAKATNIKLTEKTVFTQFGTMIGTPAYMSPEQAEMTSLDVDTRSDIYSLGVLLYELLAGSTPFPAARLRSLGFGQIQKVIAEEEPPKPSTRLSTLEGGEKTSVAQNRGLHRERLAGDLRGDLDWIVMKCLEKDRRRRYDTVNGLAMDLIRHLTNEPVLARPPSASYRFRKAYRRNRLAFSAAGVVAVVLFAGVIASTQFAIRASRAESQAKQEATRATQAEQLARDRLAALTVERDAKEIARRRAEAISNFLRGVFQSPDPARSGRTITVAETLDRATRDLDSKLEDQPNQRALLQATLASTYQSLGLYREALPLCESVYQHERAKSGPPGADYLNAISELAGAYSNLERHAEALQLREEARKLSLRLFGAESESAAACLLNLGGTLLSLKRFQEARPVLDESLLIGRRIRGSTHPGTLMALHNLASCLHELGEPERALVMREEVFEHHRQNFGPKHPATLTAMNNLAASCGAAGRHAESLRLHQEVYQLSLEVHGPDHPSTLIYLQNLLFTFQEFEGNLPATPDKIALFEESVRLTQKVKGPDHPDTIRAWENLASIQANSGNEPRAAEARAELQKHQIRTFETQPQDMAYSLRHAALMAWFGNETESLKARAQILRVASEFTDPPDLDRAAKAASLWPQSDSASQAAALRLARRAVELGAKHQYLIYFQFAQGLAEYRSGLFAAAESTWRQVAPVSTAPEILLNTTTFYRAMALFQLGRKEEAQAAFDAAVAVMTPLPIDSQYPLDGDNNADNLVNWLGYREARALLTGVPETPHPGSLAQGQ